MGQISIGLGIGPTFARESIGGGGPAADPYWSSVKLLCGFDGVNGSTTFVDESPVAHTLTKSFTMSISTAQSKFGGSSLSCGSGYLTTPDSIEWQLSSTNASPWTIECFAYLTWAGAGANDFVCQFLTTPPNRGWNFSRNLNTLSFSWASDGSTWQSVNSTGLTIATNTWHHFAVDHDATGKTRLYFNGVMCGSATPANSAIADVAVQLGIGAYPAGGNELVEGYMDELRITKGVARYASDSGFAVPTAAFPRSGPPATDPNFSSVVLLCGFNGTNGATTFVDESPIARTLTRGGNAVIDTAQFKFGTSSMRLDGTSDYITAADSADWDFGTAPFTLEGWFRFAAIDGYDTLIAQWPNAFAFWFENAQLYVRTSAGGDTTKYAWNPPLNTWYHLAFDRDGSSVARIYVDGVMVSKTTPFNVNITGSTSVLMIGSLDPGGFTTYDLNGWVDEIRITKGVARYASDSGFAVPTAAFPRA